MELRYSFALPPLDSTDFELFTMQKRSLLWEFNKEKYPPATFQEIDGSKPNLGRRNEQLNQHRLVPARVYGISDVLIMGYQGFCWAISCTRKRKVKRREQEGGNGGEESLLENVESLLEIGKQARFIGGLMQRGSAFHQPRQMERTTTQIDYSVIVAFFPTKSQIMIRQSRPRHPLKSLCSQEPR